MAIVPKDFKGREWFKFDLVACVDDGVQLKYKILMVKAEIYILYLYIIYNKNIFSFHERTK